MTGEQTGMGFRAQIKEALSKEPVSIVPVTEYNIGRFDPILTNLSALSMTTDGMVPFTDPAETNEAWLGEVKSLWLFGNPDSKADFSQHENVGGFIHVYEPEHMDKINEWLKQKNLRPYDSGAVVEYASFGLHSKTNPTLEMSATKQALAKVFVFDQEKYRDVRAVSVWVTHDADNTLNDAEFAQLKSIGAKPLGRARYHESEVVDSTCFMIPRKAFLDSLTGGAKPAPKVVSVA